MTDLAAFLTVSIVVIVTPGQDTALTIKNTLLGGRRAGVRTALGVAAGQAAWTVVTSAGLATLLVASRPAFTVLRLAGAAYLVVLGAQALWAAIRPGDGREHPGPRRTGAGAGSAFRQGLVSNLANPKMAVFFLSLLPQFVPRGGASLAVLLGLGLVFCAMTLGWLSAYAVAVGRAGDVLRRPRFRRVSEGRTGAVLVGLGIRVAAERAA
jgi:threonine/homoserine/homoserine lactone efflux protein